MLAKPLERKTITNKSQEWCKYYQHHNDRYIYKAEISKNFQSFTQFSFLQKLLL